MLDAGFWLSHMTSACYSINLCIILSLFIFFRPVHIITILIGNTGGLSQATCYFLICGWIQVVYMYFPLNQNLV